MVTLNILGTILRGFFNRNVSPDLINDYADVFSEKDVILARLEGVAKKYLEFDFPKNSYWLN